MVSFDLADGYYTLGIREEDRDFFTVNYRETLHGLAGLPMGWKCRSYYFCRLNEGFVRHSREPLPNPTGHNPRLHTNQQPTRPTPSRRYLRNSQAGCPMTPVHGLLFIFCRLQRRNVTAPRPRRVPTRPPRARTQPQLRPLGAYANLRAPRPPDRHHNLYVPSPCFETIGHRYPLPDPPTALCT
jgi:hypothetical protein